VERGIFDLVTVVRSIVNCYHFCFYSIPWTYWHRYYLLNRSQGKRRGSCSLESCWHWSTYWFSNFCSYLWLILMPKMIVVALYISNFVCCFALDGLCFPVDVEVEEYVF
jgi:hypothetical protein